MVSNSLLDWCIKNDRQDILDSWHTVLNGELTPKDVTIGIHQKFKWICPNNHVWESEIPNRRKSGCPFCSGRVPIVGINDLESQRPDLVSEWDFEKNKGISPNSLMCNSHNKVWWRCKNGHSWEASVYSRNKNSCPVCAGKKIVPGINDLKTLNPSLAEEWDPENTIDISTISPNSHIHVKWIGKCGHKWEAEIKSRHGRNRGCPYCGNRKVESGFNDLASTFPIIASEWDQGRNGGITPAEVAKRSNQSYWWKCSKCGHRWKAPVCDRAAGENCPQCDLRNKVSLGEKALAYYLNQITEVIENYHNKEILGKMELDLYLPSAGIAIEYDGRLYHGKNRLASDLKKNVVCKNNGIELIRIREHGCPPIEGCTCIESKPRFDNDFDQVLNNVISIVSERIGIQTDLSADTKRDFTDILDKKYVSVVPNSLSVCYPHLIAELHPEKNSNLDPKYIPYASNQVLWWKGACGHEWDSPVYVRTLQNQKCPICNNKRILVGFNDLATTNPTLASEWNYEKNYPVTPKDIFAGTSKIFWWKCSQGHEWQTSVASRNGGRGCPVCWDIRRKKRP